MITLDCRIEHPEKLITIPEEEYEYLKLCKNTLKEIIELHLERMQADIQAQQIRMSIALNTCQQKINDCYSQQKINDCLCQQKINCL